MQWRCVAVNNLLPMKELPAQNQQQKECVKMPMPAHQVLPLTGHIFEESVSTSVTGLNKILEYVPIRTPNFVNKHLIFNT